MVWAGRTSRLGWLQRAHPYAGCTAVPNPAPVSMGLCRPLLHASLVAGVVATMGIEDDRVKMDKCRTFCPRVIDLLVSRGGTSCHCPCSPAGNCTQQACAESSYTDGCAVCVPYVCTGHVQPGALPEPHLTCCSVTACTTLDPATHVYSFWQGFNEEGKRGFGKLFAASSTCQVNTAWA